MANVLAAERTECAAVAAEITRLQGVSGMARAELASAIGTSVSRLSTYLSGKVTLSAALLVRIRRVASCRSSSPGAASYLQDRDDNGHDHYHGDRGRVGH